MKPQDIIFLLILLFLLYKGNFESSAYKRNPKWAVMAGLSSLLLSIPLFVTWTFFTAERLTWYAASFFLLSIILHFRGR